MSPRTIHLIFHIALNVTLPFNAIKERNYTVNHSNMSVQKPFPTKENLAF